MNKSIELLLTILALAGMYCAIPTNAVEGSNSAGRAQQEVLIADGSDPMPLCRGRQCANK